ncbi:MAG: 2-oxoglutarate dehydrogenase E1 component [Desulfuromonadales bacterium]
MGFTHNITPQWLEEMYQRWKNDPEDTPPDWQGLFQGFELGAQTPASVECLDPEMAFKQSAVQSLIYRYRDMGHLLACTDPLAPCPTEHPQLDLKAFDLSEDDLDTVFHIKRFWKKSATLREILTVMRETYCRTLGVEFMHIQDPDERLWLKERMESSRNCPSFDPDRKKGILYSLFEAALFEAFLHRKFVGQKRFSLEGAEVLIPTLRRLIEKAAEEGIGDIVLGMSHRGRLNVLANIFGKPLSTLFAEFEDNIELGFVGEGDVKYHRGFSTDIQPDGKNTLHLTLASNPSHLEAVNPVVEGKCRSRQDRHDSNGRKKVLPILIHGDAAFAGQGMVSETLNLSQLKGFRTGGTLHLVINNQIGFTTTAEEGRSTLYSTDVAKMLAVPIFHVHGEDPETAVHAIQTALDYRQKFGKDAVVEIICFRRMGHNEGDEPHFTQPLMYEKIDQRPPVHTLYARQLAEEGMASEEIEEMTETINRRIKDAVDQTPVPADEGFRGHWSMVQRDFSHHPTDTTVNEDRLREMAQKLAELPKDFTAHSKIEKLLEKRLKAVEEGEGIDWGNAETLSYASLLAEGTTVRLSGQDSQRGTFNHRHAVLVDNRTAERYIPLQRLCTGDARIHIFNSMLSEAAVLGFEYGYSLENPFGLTIWEAQFGDFANGAQVIIDQFVVSSGSKWDRVCGLAMFLPHGYEGQGAEHSSARIERFLQLCADNNIQVVYPSTPAQFFHLLRRQVKQPFRRPLIVFTPKSLLRLPACRSRLADLSQGHFREILPDDSDPAKVRTVLLCSGKVYYDLLARKKEEEREDMALIRVEQLYPLRHDLLSEALAPLHNAGVIAWVQEEPENAGAWSHLRGQLEDIIGHSPLYIGRPAAASPAVGSHRLHTIEQKRLLDRAFEL